MTKCTNTTWADVLTNIHKLGEALDDLVAMEIVSRLLILGVYHLLVRYSRVHVRVVQTHVTSRQETAKYNTETLENCVTSSYWLFDSRVFGLNNFILVLLEGGPIPKGGRQPTIWLLFSQNYKIEEILARAASFASPDPPICVIPR